MKKVIVRIVLMALIVTAISAAALTATAEWKITSSPFRLPKIILKTPVEEAEENAAEEATPEEAIAEEATPAEATPEEVIAEEATPAEATPEEATAEEAKSDEANDTEKKTEEELPEEDQKETSPEQDISKEENIEITESDETVAEEMIARTGMVVLQQNEAYLIVYEEANEESEELGQIQGGELIEVLQISESWSLIRYNEMTGYVKSEKIALLKYGEDEEEEETTLRSVTISNNVSGQPFIYEGTEVIFTVTLKGFENLEYEIIWQYSPDGGETVIDIPDEHSLTYAFNVSMENQYYLWRVRIEIIDEIPSEPSGEAEETPPEGENGTEQIEEVQPNG